MTILGKALKKNSPHRAGYLKDISPKKWALSRSLIELLGKLHTTNTLEVTLDCSSFLALAFSGWLFAKLASTHVCQEAGFFDAALKAT